MKIPYAKSHFPSIRSEGYFYVDKTPFFLHIENADDDHLIFLRPRRFGKSTLLSTLENYYDVVKADRFDELFEGLWIHENPTPKKNQYLVLRLDFSPVDSDGAMQDIRKSFAHQVKAAVSSFIHRNAKLIPALSTLGNVLLSPDDNAADLMMTVLTMLGDAGQQMYLLIDEYDHFGNRLLADGKTDAYQELIQTTGFVRSFYAALKAATTTGALARTFITGVSPIMLDDLSSGFNIITHISTDAEFNAMAGFTRADVERAIDTLLTDIPALRQEPRIGNRDALLKTLETFYDGYRFSQDAHERMYNSTLVLYFLSQLKRSGRYPRKMLDLNVRTDYGRLYQIAKSTSQKDTDTRELLEEILTKDSVTVSLVEQFGTRMHLGRPQIASLFYYMGMLTFAEDTEESDAAKLVIPNRVMRELQWEYMSFALADHDGIQLQSGNLASILTKMAEQGDIQPLVDLFHEQVVGRLGLRETINFNEQAMKLMLFAYLSQTEVFYLMTEKEFNHGYCDLLLGLRGHGSASKYAWIIEAKYVKTDADDTAIEKVVDEGFAQIERYTSDEDFVAMLTLGRQLKAGVLVFVGLRDVQYRSWSKGT